MAWKGLQHILTVSQLGVCLLYIMFRYTSCLESYWEEMSSLQNYVPYSDSEFTKTTASSLFTCIVKKDDCPCGWYRFENSCFLFADVDLTWPESVTFCQGLDAELIEVDTKLKDEFLQKVANTRRGFKNMWAAGSDDVEEGSWVWITSGSPMTNYTNWSGSQPDNDGGSSGEDANCVCLGEWFQFAWDDCYCLMKFAPICEKPVTGT